MFVWCKACINLWRVDVCFCFCLSEHWGSSSQRGAGPRLPRVLTLHRAGSLTWIVRTWLAGVFMANRNLTNFHSFMSEDHYDKKRFVWKLFKQTQKCLLTFFFIHVKHLVVVFLQSRHTEKGGVISSFLGHSSLGFHRNNLVKAFLTHSYKGCHNSRRCLVECLENVFTLLFTFFLTTLTKIICDRQTQRFLNNLARNFIHCFLCNSPK